MHDRSGRGGHWPVAQRLLHVAGQLVDSAASGVGNAARAKIEVHEVSRRGGPAHKVGECESCDRGTFRLEGVRRDDDPARPGERPEDMALFITVTPAKGEKVTLGPFDGAEADELADIRVRADLTGRRAGQSDRGRLEQGQEALRRESRNCIAGCGNPSDTRADINSRDSPDAGNDGHKHAAEFAVAVALRAGRDMEFVQMLRHHDAQLYVELLAAGDALGLAHDLGPEQRAARAMSALLSDGFQQEPADR